MLHCIIAIGDFGTLWRDGLMVICFWNCVSNVVQISGIIAVQLLARDEYA